MKHSFFNSCLPLLAASLLAMSSCTKEYTDINININTGTGESEGSGSGSGGTDSTGTLIRVNFRANVEGLQATKALTPFGQNQFASIFVYPQGSNLSTTPLYNNLYHSNSAGSLVAVSQDVYLSDGSYDFYVVATNQSSNMNPIFNDGISTSELKNGIDYLWGDVINQPVNTSPENVQFILYHKCTQVVIQLTAGNGVTLNSIQSATVLPPVTATSRMSLSTGGITPATTLASTPFAMGVNASVCQATILPVSNVTSMAATFSLIINGESQARNYDLSIPLPDNQLQGGKSYVFKGIVSSNTINFSQVLVQSWTIVDETGTPLYPDEVN